MVGKPRTPNCRWGMQEVVGGRAWWAAFWTRERCGVVHVQTWLHAAREHNRAAAAACRRAPHALMAQSTASGPRAGGPPGPHPCSLMCAAPLR